MPAAIRKPLTAGSFNNAARHTTDTREFVALLERALSEIAPHNTVQINQAALHTFAGQIEPVTSVDYGWNNYMSPKASEDPFDLVRVFHEMAAITGQQGGYFYPQPMNGLDKWEVKGSGAKAMIQKMDEIRATIATPGFNTIEAHRLGLSVTAIFKNTPYARWRAQAMKEFMHGNSLRTTKALLADITDAGGTLLFTLPTAHKIAQRWPVSYGGDPFLKKANLLMLMTAAHIDSRPHSPQRPSYILNTIAAADYRLPQALSAEGVGILKLHSRLQNCLRRGEAMQLDDADVIKLRAGAVVAADKLMKISGRSLSEVDGALWSAGSALEKAGKALPPMKVMTTHF